MFYHFNTRAEAVAHLEANGWRELENGRWVSRDGACAASIHPARGEKVVVAAWEIERPIEAA